MHRLDKRQKAVVLTVLRVLEDSWRDANYNADIFRTYGIAVPEIIKDLVTWKDWGRELHDIINVIATEGQAPLTETPDDSLRDLQIIYERLNITPPTD
jgi:hypothetical protein